MAPYSPTSVEVEKALDAVYYGIDQLVAMVTAETKDQNLDNAIIESRLLHARTLIDFFEKSTRYEDDILATDYSFPPTRIVSIGQDDRDRLHKDLAHLTYSRTRRTDADKAWLHHRVVGPVLERCRSFIEHVLASRSTFSEHGRTDWENLQTRVARAITVKAVDLCIRPLVAESGVIRTD